MYTMEDRSIDQAFPEPRYWDNNLLKNFFKLLFATSFIYILGLAWLGNLIGWDKPVFQLGAQPFLLAELFKILIATFAINQIKKIANMLKRINQKKKLKRNIFLQ